MSITLGNQLNFAGANANETWVSNGAVLDANGWLLQRVECATV
jgi:hypothetical protein